MNLNELVTDLTAIGLKPILVGFEEQNQMSTLPRKQRLAMIDSFYSRLARVCEASSDWPKYMDLVQAYERDYRASWSKVPGIIHGLTLGQCVRLMAVHQIFRCFVARPGETVRVPKAEDFFFTRPDVFGGYAIAKLMEAEIRKEFSDQEMLDWLTEIDYADLENNP